MIMLMNRVQSMGLRRMHLLEGSAERERERGEGDEVDKDKPEECARAEGFPLVLHQLPYHVIV